LEGSAMPLPLPDDVLSEAPRQSRHLHQHWSGDVPELAEQCRIGDVVLLKELGPDLRETHPLRHDLADLGLDFLVCHGLLKEKGWPVASLRRASQHPCVLIQPRWATDARVGYPMNRSSAKYPFASASQPTN